MNQEYVGQAELMVVAARRRRDAAKRLCELADLASDKPAAEEARLLHEQLEQEWWDRVMHLRLLHLAEKREQKKG